MPGERAEVFTQCAKCETVFRLSADVLRAAGGQVRCGRCGEVFNALQRLAEDASAFSVGESSLDLEARADAILESTEPVAPADPGVQPGAAELPAIDEPDPGVEVAQLQFIDPVDEELAGETSLEFTLPPGELDRIFVETRPRALQRLAIPGRRADDPPVAPLPAPPPVPTPAPPAASVSTAAPPPEPSEAGAVGPNASPVMRREKQEDFAREELSKLNPPRRRLPLLVWSGIAAALALLLALQLYRGSGGADGELHAGLSAYQWRQWGVTGDPANKGVLRVRASIMNASAQLQPYPLLRVTLANRFGTHVGRREFEPAEYLGKPTALMLAPGQQLDATLDILDPGKDAEGFEIDVCVRGPDKKVLCAGDAAAQTK